MKKIMKMIDDFNTEREWHQFHTPANLAKSIVIEASELLELFQWQDQPKSLDNLKEELADVLSYCLMLAQHYDLDLEEILEAKIKKNALKYPTDKAKGRSEKYDEFD
ncbi:MAG: nucleotide pyrophosphohydrolase [Bacilli bacterium]